jgi:hypothetical protein
MADKGFLSFDSPSSNQNRLLMLSPLPKRVKPEGNVNIVKGIVFDEFDSPMQSEIEWVDVDDSEQIGKLSSKPITGEYYTPLPSGKEYIIFPKKKNSIITSAILNYKNDKSFSEKSNLRGHQYLNLCPNRSCRSWIYCNQTFQDHNF